MDGLAVTTEPVVVFNPVDGDHLYVEAPLTVILTAVPEQTAGFAGLKVNAIGGIELTVTCDEVTGSQTKVEFAEYDGKVICQFAIVPVVELARS